MWLFDLLIYFPSVLQILYVEVRISRNISENPLDFELTGVDYIYTDLGSLITYITQKNTSSEQTKLSER